jgi:hypothetical protein
MLFSLHRDSSVKRFLSQKFADSSNNFISWLIVSLVYCLTFSTFVSQYVLIVPKKVANIQLIGYELNKFGFTFFSVSIFYLIKTSLSYTFFASTGNLRKWSVFYFTASKFYFCLSVVLMISSFINSFYDINRLWVFDLFIGSVLFLFLFKIIYYLFHKDDILPEKWYYKILYICTLQIVPVLVLWKALFF